MTQRQRKLTGVFACLAFLIVYCLIVMAVGGHFIVGQQGFIEFSFYLAAGFLWLPPVMSLIRWMARPDRS